MSIANIVTSDSVLCNFEIYILQTLWTEKNETPEEHLCVVRFCQTAGISTDCLRHPLSREYHLIQIASIFLPIHLVMLSLYDVFSLPGCRFSWTFPVSFSSPVVFSNSKAVFTQRSLSDLTLDQSKVRSDKVCVNTLNRIGKPDR